MCGRREFYGAFTKRTLAKTGDNDEGEDIPPTVSNEANHLMFAYGSTTAV